MSILLSAVLIVSGWITKDPPTAVVTATVYNAVVGQTDDTPLITATGFQIDTCNLPKIVAVSRDLEDIIPLGSVIKVTGTDYDGVYQVQDRMHSRWRNKIDILVPKHITLGKWHAVQIWKIK